MRRLFFFVGSVTRINERDGMTNRMIRDKHDFINNSKCEFLHNHYETNETNEPVFPMKYYEYCTLQGVKRPQCNGDCKIKFIQIVSE